MAKTPKQSTQIPLTEVVFTTIDSPDLQTIYVDGVTGSQTTRNTLRATFYEEYFPIPETERRQLTHKGGNTRQLHNLPVRTSVRPAEHEVLEP